MSDVAQNLIPTASTIAATDKATGLVGGNTKNIPLNLIKDLFIQKDIDFSTTIPFDRMISHMASHTITGPTTFSVNTAGAVAGYGTIMRLIADGANVPDISALKKSNASKDWANAAGTLNVVVCFYDGADYWYTLFQEVGALPALATPGSPAATGVSSTQIDVSWTDVVNETGYEIQVSADGGATWAALTTTAANATSYAHTGLSASTTRHYRIRAKGDGTTHSDSSWSATVNATTSATGTTYDTDAQAGFNRIQTTLGATITTTEKGAVSDLITALKSAGVWGSKVQHLEAYCGSTANAMMTNYKDPTANGSTSDGAPAVNALGLKFIGGVDAEDTGVSFASVAAALTDNNLGVTFLIQEAIQNIFVGNSGGVNEFKIYNSDGATLMAYPHIGALSSGITIPSIVGGLHTYQRNGSALEHYRGSSFIGSSTNAFTSWGGSGNVTLHKHSTTIQAADTTVGLFIFHTAFTSTEQAAVTSAINTFRTALSR